MTLVGGLGACTDYFHGSSSNSRIHHKTVCRPFKVKHVGFLQVLGEV